MTRQSAEYENDNSELVSRIITAESTSRKCRINKMSRM